ncbi:MAG: hypothetical protein HC815_40050, partial [Richelia sp. RM1_1_1]|nr:hypothetical protein [Richelia sp. RM1_1_1]
ERDIPALKAARDGQLVKLSVLPHDKTDNSSSFSSNLDSNNQPSAKDKEPNTPQEPNQQLVIDNELNTTQENIYYQQEYAARIAPTIRQFWVLNKQPQCIKGKHYSIKLEEGILTLTRKNGKKIADIPTDNSTPPQGFDLNESDVQRFLELQRILNNHIELQNIQKNRGLER